MRDVSPPPATEITSIGSRSSAAAAALFTWVTPMEVVPLTVPPITSVSALRVAKLTSMASAPPPWKFPSSARLSSAAESFVLSVPPFTRSVAAAAVPTLTMPFTVRLAPAPISRAFQFSTRPTGSAPETFLNVSVPAPPPLNSVTSPNAAPSKTRSREEAASVIEPVSAAPLSTLTVSQFSRPEACTEACSDPDPAANRSVSFPAPPSICVTLPNTPPAKTATSAPAPSLTAPAIAAPVFTVRVVLPDDPMIALCVPEPTMAPLLRVIMAAPVPTSVLIAATFAPEPPVTAPDTDMDAPPLPS